jgi:hypothetical protein
MGVGRAAFVESENDQFMRHAVQPRLLLVATTLGELRKLIKSNVWGATEAAVQRLADQAATIVTALKGHPDRVRTIGSWEDIVHARGLQRVPPVAEASDPLVYRLPMALLQKIGEALRTLELVGGTAGEVLRAFTKIGKLTAQLRLEVDEDNVGRDVEAVRPLLEDIQGIADFVTSLMPLDFISCDAKFGAACLGRRHRPQSPSNSMPQPRCLHARVLEVDRDAQFVREDFALVHLQQRVSRVQTVKMWTGGGKAVAEASNAVCAEKRARLRHTTKASKDTNKVLLSGKNGDGKSTTKKPGRGSFQEACRSGAESSSGRHGYSVVLVDEAQDLDVGHFENTMKKIKIEAVGFEETNNAMPIDVEAAIEQHRFGSANPPQLLRVNLPANTYEAGAQETSEAMSQAGNHWCQAVDTLLGASTTFYTATDEYSGTTALQGTAILELEPTSFCHQSSDDDFGDNFDECHAGLLRSLHLEEDSDSDSLSDCPDLRYVDDVPEPSAKAARHAVQHAIEWPWPCSQPGPSPSESLTRLQTNPRAPHNGAPHQRWSTRICRLCRCR